jgi:hypothetical protein
MADTTYVDDVTVITADTMNDLNRLHYTFFGDPASLVAALTGRTYTNNTFAGTNSLTGTFAAAATDLGTITTGTVTPNPQTQPIAKYTNNGAHTLAPSANEGTIVVLITNGASAGAVTTSGFTKVAGDSFTTTNAHKFMCSIAIINSVSLLTIQALQ